MTEQPSFEQRRGRRRRADLDDIDRQLCELLADDPGLTRRSLGLEVGLTDETVTARLRTLRERNIIATTVAVDWESAGYHAAAILRCTVRGRDVVRSAAAALRSPSVVYAARTSGCCDLVLALLDVDHAALRTEIARIRQLMPAVQVVGTHLVIEALAYNARAHTLPVTRWTADEIPNPVVELDDIDRAMINMMTIAGDESNREIARRLGVSDATVRTRLRRLEDANLLKIVTARDPIAFGDLNAHALAFLELNDLAALESIAPLASVQGCYGTVTGSDAVVAVAAEDEAGLQRVLTHDLREVDGVLGMHVAHVVTIIRHRAHLVRLVRARTVDALNANQSSVKPAV